MGNRATIVFSNKTFTQFSPAIYLHWNGGPESVYAFLAELDRRQVRHEIECEAARFVHVVCDFFDGDEASEPLSVYLFPTPRRFSDLLKDPTSDNGVYLIHRSPEATIVRRVVRNGPNVRELTADEVVSERQRASVHRYANPKDGILAQLKRLRRLKINPASDSDKSMVA